MRTGLCRLISFFGVGIGDGQLHGHPSKGCSPTRWTEGIWTQSIVKAMEASFVSSKDEIYRTTTKRP